jgi:pantoate kinase
MATPEAKVKAKIKEILKHHGVYWSMPVGTGYGNSGIPDFLCCVPPHGRFLAIEAKANGGKTTALQDKNLADIANGGGYSVVIDEHGYALLDGIINDLKGK